MRTNFCENVKKKSLFQPPKQEANKALLTYAVETLLGSLQLFDGSLLRRLCSLLPGDRMFRLRRW